VGPANRFARISRRVRGARPGVVRQPPGVASRLPLAFLGADPERFAVVADCGLLVLMDAEQGGRSRSVGLISPGTPAEVSSIQPATPSAPRPANATRLDPRAIHDPLRLRKR